jgi:periplasmic divalent cation tolerance protein
MKSDYCIVVTTVDDPDTAAHITKSLLDKKLAACIQHVPIQSHYRWQGAVEASSEIRLEIKTRSDLFEAVKSEIIALHSYDLPEIIAIPIGDAHTDYLEWIDTSVRSL